MLKSAQLYEGQLKQKFIESWYDLRNMYYNGWSGTEVPELPNNNYEQHHFVSVNSKNEIIGYIAYNVCWISMSADRFGIISFDKGNLEFIKDVKKVIDDLFCKYNMNRLQWSCYVDNPAIRGYRNFIKKYGGRECGYYRQVVKLQDGKLHDSVEFEILADEFKGGQNEKI